MNFSRLITLINFISAFYLAASSSHEQIIGLWDLEVDSMIRPDATDTSIQFFHPKVLSPTTSRKLSYLLSLLPNGTFSLTDKENNGIVINGIWELGKNPYCPTDRFYDDLLLESFPRVKRKREEIIQRLSFQLKCKVYGRYNGHGQRLLRLKHGYILKKTGARQYDSFKGWWKVHRVCATFKGTSIDNDESECESLD
jgi:hypothetical protein